MKKHTKTGNASEGFIRPVAAPLRTWVVPHVDWLMKVAAVSLQVRRSGGKKKNQERLCGCACALPKLSNLCCHGYLSKANLRKCKRKLG